MLQKTTAQGTVSAAGRRLTFSSPNGATRWTATLDSSDIGDVGWTPQGIVTFTQTGGVKTPDSRLMVSLLAQASGRVIWKRTFTGSLSHWTGKKMWNSFGRIMVVFLTEGDFVVNAVGLRTADGVQVWSVDGVMRSVYRNARFLLFRPYVIGNPLFSPQSLLLVSVDLTSDVTTSFDLTIAPRQNCGALKEGDLDAGFAEFATRDAYVVIWNDGCGVFTTRYDWHGFPTQVPVVSNGTATR